MRNATFFLVVIVCLAYAGWASAVSINEWVANDVSTDDHEFVELCGDPFASLDGLSIVIIEGEGSGAGIIDRIWPLDGYSINAAGYFVIGGAAVSPDLVTTDSIENGGNTILLVDGLDPQYPTGTDIDAENDCVADFSIGTIVDGIGTGFGYSALDCTYYGVVTVGPDGTYDPAGAARCDDCAGPAGDWYLICLNGTEPDPTGIECSTDDGYYIGWATPGAANDCSPIDVEGANWGSMKAMYR